MNIMTVVGARPQFIKAWPVGEALRNAGYVEWLVHTGQHYDDQMSQIFFDEMGLARPERNLDIGSGPHGAMTGRMLIALEAAMVERRPDWVLVYGDTNSTLAAALAACKLGIPVAHVEAGLRSFNRSMPEEHNRVLTDHCSDLLLCPTRTAVENLAREGVVRGVHNVGDVMLDAVLHFGAIARDRSAILGALKLEPGEYMLATIHRAYNTDEPTTLLRLIQAMEEIGTTIVFPIHPRTRARLEACGESQGIAKRQNVRLVDPVGYLDMLMLEQQARAILTDSGGVQKEAYFFSVPCITLRPETEWVETVESGWNVLVGSDIAAIVAAAREIKKPDHSPPALFGAGDAAKRIATLLD